MRAVQPQVSGDSASQQHSVGKRPQLGRAYSAEQTQLKTRKAQGTSQDWLIAAGADADGDGADVSAAWC